MEIVIVPAGIDPFVNIQFGSCLLEKRDNPFNVRGVLFVVIEIIEIGVVGLAMYIRFVFIIIAEIIAIVLLCFLLEAIDPALLL